MNRRALIVSASAATFLCLLCILLIDVPVARALGQEEGPVSLFFAQGTRVLEVLSGFDVSKWALGLLLLGCGLVLLIWRKWRPAAWALLFVAASQLTTRLVAGVLKNVFLRSRPSELLASGVWDTQFFQPEGSSFPSGHAAHFWGLFFALAYLFPRYRLPLALIPLFVSAARVVVNDHFVSDVVASAAIAAFITLGYTYLPHVRRRVPTRESATRFSERLDDSPVLQRGRS